MQSTTSLKTLKPITTPGVPANAWLEAIREALAGVDFGSIQIKVHAGEVVQIETTRKIRIPSLPSPTLLSQPTEKPEAI